MERFTPVSQERSPAQEAFSDWRELKRESETEVQTLIGPEFELKTEEELAEYTIEEMSELYAKAKEVLPIVQAELVKLDVSIGPDNPCAANNKDRHTVAALARYQKFCESILGREYQNTSGQFAAHYPPRELGFSHTQTT